MFVPIWALLELSCTQPEEADILVGFLAKALIYPSQVKEVDAGQRITNYLVYGIPVEFDYWNFIREGGKPNELAEMFDTGQLVTYEDRLAYMHIKYPEGMDAAIQAVIRMVDDSVKGGYQDEPLYPDEAAMLREQELSDEEVNLVEEPTNDANETFREWMDKVDNHLQDRIGLITADLPDMDYWVRWDTGYSWEEMAEGIISDLEDGSL